MILRSLTLTNFGTFRGQQTLSLTPHPSRPVILVGGMNGAGKTTVFEAIQLCLYGAGALGARASRDAYLTYADTRIHTNPTLLIQPTFASIALEFEYADPDARHHYRVTRSWDRGAPSKLSEYLEIERDGKRLDELSADHWQDFVRDLIPPGVAQFFFFDGEKIQQLAADTANQTILADSIKALLGLDIVDRLSADLGVYSLRLTKENGGSPASAELERLEQDLHTQQEHLAELRRIRAKHDAQISDIQGRIEQVEAKIATEGGGFARSRERLLEERAHIKTLIEQKEHALRQLCAGILPAALAGDLARRLAQQLELEANQEAAETAAILLRRAKRSLGKSLSATSMWQGITFSDEQKRILRSLLHTALAQALATTNQPATQLIHRVSPDVRRQLLTWLNHANTQASGEARHLARDLERQARQLHRVQEQLSRAPNEESLKPLVEDLHHHYHHLTEVSKQAMATDQEITVADRLVSELQRRLQRAAERLAANHKLGQRLRLIPRLQTVLAEYSSALVARRVIQLQDAVTTCFNRLCRKQDVLREIRIDPNDFSVVLLDKQGNRLPKDRLSAGEKQIFAVSMLWALAKTSGRPLPIIIDTPLGRLDSAHRRLLVEHYFPVASHQVVILSTDTEVDQAYFHKLKPKLSRAYHLAFDPVDHSTTVQEGYFWENVREAL